MESNLAKLGFNEEIVSWLRSLGNAQMMRVLEFIATIFKFAEKKKEFFQGCGLYVVGSSLKGGGFNDVDIVLVGLDFRAVVRYDRIFLMDPEILIQKEILVEPCCFLVIKEEEGDYPEVLKPTTDPDASENIEAWGRMGLEHKGLRYDYNIDRLMGKSLSLEGYCSYHAWPSSFIEKICKLYNLVPSYPFDHYGFNGTQSFLVYRLWKKSGDNDKLSVKNSNVDDLRPIDFCIHAENLYREDWKKHQRFIGLDYLVFKEWPQTCSERKIITELDYPRFIDPKGKKRAKWDSMFASGFQPDVTLDGDIIDIQAQG